MAIKEDSEGTSNRGMLPKCTSKVILKRVPQPTIRHSEINCAARFSRLPRRLISVGRATQNAANQVKYPNGYRVTKQIVCTAVFGRQ
jgi:hypothetical protein